MSLPYHFISDQFFHASHYTAMVRLALTKKTGKEGMGRDGSFNSSVNLS